MHKELVERARHGDHDAFAMIADASIKRLDAAARLILHDPDRAQDAVQEALVRCWRDLPQLRDPDRFEAWLYRLLLRACYDEARRTKRQSVEVEIGPLDPGSTASADVQLADRDQLQRGLSRLSAEQRAVIVLHHYLDLPLTEVAAALGIPVGTAKSRLHRATQLLRAALEADARAARPQPGIVA